jgi:hypothetical protein
VKPAPQIQATDAERILIRALASSRQMQAEVEYVSGRDGVDDEFDPARQARFALQTEKLHRGLATESLIDILLQSGPDLDVMQVECSESDRRLLALILMNENEELTADRLEGAVRALRRIHLRRRLEQLQRELKQPGIGDDKVRMRDLLLEVERLSRSLRDPNLAEIGAKAGIESQKTA